jgi:hypothetical protein
MGMSKLVECIRGARWWLPVLGGVLLLALGAGLAWAADPGSKEDPLATLSYVQRYAQFSRLELPAGRSLRLGIGAELVLADTLQGAQECRGLDGMKDDLLDLSTGERCAVPLLTPGHLYVNASAHDIFLTFPAETVVLLRGEWK